MFFARNATAQKTSDLGAFSALMVSPIGALPPLTRDYSGFAPDTWDVNVRFGTWRYDIDDGDHNTVGITVARRVWGKTSLALTGAYITLDCACSVWASGSVALRTQLFTIAEKKDPKHHVAAHLASAIELGEAKFTGTPTARASSVSALLDAGFAMPAAFGSRLTISVLPGIGRGAFASVDLTAQALRPLIGGAASWSIGRGLSIDAGFNRVVIEGEPIQWGAGFSWRRP